VSSTGFGGRVSSAFYANPHLLVLAVVTIAVAGVSAWMGLPRLEDPRITNRSPIVITPVPGVSADRVDALVTERLEEALQEVAEIKDIQSTSRDGVSIISVSLKDEITAAENDEIFSKMRDRLGDAEPDLPPEAQSPFLDDERPAVAFTLITAIVWEGDKRDLPLGMMDRLAEDLSDRLRAIEGTEIVRNYGEPTEEMTVLADRSALSIHSITPDQVARRIAEADAKGSAGVLRGAASDLPLEVDGELTTSARIGFVPVGRDDSGAVFRVSDVADVRRTWRDPPEEIGLVDGRRAVFIAARMGPGSQISRWRTEAGEVLDEFKSKLGGTVSLDVIFDQSNYTNDRLGELGSNLLLGACVVVIVILMVMGWRSALVVGMCLPLVAGLVLAGTLLRGVALHQMSIFGMIIALGLLVDNAIVVTDDVNSKLEAGAERLAAVRDSIDHLFFPLLASTITTMLAFAPIMLLPGNAGDFVGSIGGSVVLAVGSSFAVSMTIIAALAGGFGRRVRPGGSRWWIESGVSHPRLTHIVRLGLRFGMRAPAGLALIALILPVAGFSVGPTLGREFFPPVDRDMFDVRIWLPRGVSVDESRRIAERAEDAVRASPEIERVYWLVGGSFPSVYYNQIMNRDRASHYAQAIVTAEDAEAATRLISALQRRLDDRLPEARVVVRAFAQGPPSEAPVEYRVFATRDEERNEVAERLRVLLQNHPDVTHTGITEPRGNPKLWVVADEDEADRAGLTYADMARQLRGAIDGFPGGTVLEDVEEMPVRVRLADGQRDSAAEVRSTNFIPAARAQFGEQNRWVPLHALGDLELRPQAGGLTRFDGLRVTTVQGYTRHGALAIDAATETLEAFEQAGGPPRGVRIELGGEAEQDSEATGNLLLYAPVLALLMVTTLVLTFRSARIFLILSMVGGLCVGLALLSTWTINFPVSFNTILGTLGLVGVGLNDSIVVVAAIRADPRAGAGDPDAMAEAVLGTFRHLISTTLTTIGGFLPLLIFTGGNFWPSLAIVLAGGVGGATLIAALFVPAMYKLIVVPRRPAPA